ncbi:MAG: GspE/PulE family protein, partial [Pseudomonadota bacterium]
QFGESVVMRLLDQTAGILDLESTGLPDDLLERFRQLIHRPHGLVLVTGPTGSGKTTTLYGALNEINEPGVKIITAEDPVEYTLPRLTQVQINQKIGLDFGTVLRSCLRQDPDIMLVGEMRDSETAEIGLRAALTGHLVLSTLHTNDAMSSAMRLIDMGIEPYLVASALSGILAQRLIKKVCEHCTEDYELTPRDRVWLRSLQGHEEGSFVKGAGCYHCGNTGFHGRMGVHELLEFNEEMLDALRVNDQIRLEKAVANDPSFKTLSMQALAAAHAGKTSLSEVFRISADNLDDGTVPEVSHEEASGAN